MYNSLDSESRVKKVAHILALGILRAINRQEQTQSQEVPSLSTNDRNDPEEETLKGEDHSNDC